MNAKQNAAARTGADAGRIVVVGSVNMDMVVRCDRFPRPGETVLGSAFNMFPGGKGANQAVAASKLGGDVYFLAKMGQDLFRTRLLESLSADGVNVDHVLLDPEEPTGVAMISVDGCGENEIVVASGSNMRLQAAEIEAERTLLKSASVLLLQLEIPVDTVRAAARLGREVGAMVVLNPAPAMQLSPDVLSSVDFLTPNEIEASKMTGIDVVDFASGDRAGKRFLEMGVGRVIITMGAQGALLVEPGQSRVFPAFPARVVDTTGAGDAFNGGLAFGLAAGYSVDAAVTLGNRVAAYSVMYAGAQTSLPTAAQISAETARTAVTKATAS